MRYAKCINNKPYLDPPDSPSHDYGIIGLTIGKIYKVMRDPVAEHLNMVRVIDETFGEAGSEDGYLYPKSYFEPFERNGSTATSITIAIDEFTKGVLQAEAIASDQSVSAMVRDWIEDRLDLPA